MKLSTLSATVALLAVGFSSSTMAAVVSASPSSIQTPDVVLNFAGASAQDKAILALLKNDVCQANTLTIYKDSYASNGTGNASSGTWGGRWQAWACTAVTTQPAGISNSDFALISGKKIQINKRSAGGSGVALLPQVNNPSLGNSRFQVNFMNPSVSACNLQETSGTSVSGTAVPTYGCVAQETDIKTPGTNTALSNVDAGLTDTNPELYTGINTVAEFGIGIDPTDIATLDVHVADAIPMGVPVTLELYKALQTAQGLLSAATNPYGVACTLGQYNNQACVPNLSRTQIASLVSGTVSSWDHFIVNGVALTTAYPPAANTDHNVHFCQRTAGSGTAAAFYAKVLSAPCSPYAVAPPISSSNTVHQVYETVDMELCLDDLDKGTQVAIDKNTGASVNGGIKGWGIGQSAADKNSSTSLNYRFVKLDGQLPTAQNIFNGTYTFWSESSWITSKAPNAPAGAKAALVNFFEANAVLATQLGNTKGKLQTTQPWGTVSFFALPGSGNTVTSTLDLTKPVVPYSHKATGAFDSSAGDLCAIPSVTTDLVPAGN